MTEGEGLRELVDYRLERARETYADAKILAEHDRWNSAINRLYYASYYAVTALLLHRGVTQTTHNGAKRNFSLHFITSGKLEREHGVIYSRLFNWRQKSDYDDLFDFTDEKVSPYFQPVAALIDAVAAIIESERSEG